MRMFDLLTSGVIFAGRRGWGVVAMLGLGFGVILALGGSWARWVYLLFLLFPALEDARTGYVSDGWALGLALCGLLTMISRGEALYLATGAGMGALYGLLYLISKKSLGLADVFLAAASSLWLLPVYGLLSLWLTSLAALLWCAFLLLRRQLGRRTEIRFVPFLAIGGALAYGVQETVGMAFLLASLGLSSL